MFNSNTPAFSAAYRSAITHTHTPQSKQKHHKHYYNTNSTHAAIEGYALSTNEECLSNDDDTEEDEDHNQSFNFQKIQHRQQSLYTYSAAPFITNELCSYLKSSLFYFGQESHKYIMQGVLRI
ncbi:hypothetical protein DBR32_02235 [Taibaiella sp. KBW10]|nr:hypothetical protein DBR32_02235 [Taibaiella sp. KBW10]